MAHEILQHALTSLVLGGLLAVFATRFGLDALERRVAVIRRRVRRATAPGWLPESPASRGLGW